MQLILLLSCFYYGLFLKEMNKLGKVFIWLILLALCSCKGNKAYQDAISSNNIQKYEYYISAFPKHKTVKSAEATMENQD